MRLDMYKLYMWNYSNFYSCICGRFSSGICDCIGSRDFKIERPEKNKNTHTILELYFVLKFVYYVITIDLREATYHQEILNQQNVLTLIHMKRCREVKGDGGRGLLVVR